MAVRINPETFRKARHAALDAETTVGKWLEDAIEEKLQREKESNSERADR